MLPTSGDGSARIRYNTTSRQWEVRTGGTDRLTVSDTTTTVGNSLSVTGDISSAGGAAQTFLYTKARMLQNSFAEMTASVTVVSSSDTTHQSFTGVPMVRSGSILGLVIYCEGGEVIKSGTLSASVTVNGANTGLTAFAGTGSIFGVSAAKDTYTFNGYQTVGVSLTASAGYLCEPDVTSASFLASVLVEM